MATNDGGSAFPGFQHFIAQREDSKGPIQVMTGQPHGGMSLRDFFAAQAIATLMQIARPTNADELAAQCYEMADAMLRARDAKSPREVADAHIADWGRK